MWIALRSSCVRRTKPQGEETLPNVTYLHPNGYLLSFFFCNCPILLVAKKQMDGHIWVEGRWQPLIRQSITCDQSRAGCHLMAAYNRMNKQGFVHLITALLL